MATAANPSRGGSTSNTLGMCQALSSLGADVEMVATNSDEIGSWSPFHKPARLDAALGVPVDWQGVKSYFFDVVPPSRFAMARGLGAWLRARAPSYDVIHIHSLYRYPGLIAARTAQRHGVPYVVSPHGELAPYHRRRRRLRKLLFFRLFELSNLNRAAAIQYTSKREMDAADLIPIKAPGFIVPAGVELAEARVGRLRGQFRAEHPEVRGKLIITFLGRLVHQKGLDLLIPAFARVTKEFPDSHLVIAGPVEDSYGRSVSEWVRASRIEDRVTFTGFVDRDAKAVLLADTDIWVLPSREENFGIAIAEAMACGLPVIVSDNTGIHADIAEAKAGIVVRCEVTEIVAALAKLMNEPELRRTMGRNGQELVRQRFTWETAAQQMMTVYEAIRRK